MGLRYLLDTNICIYIAKEKPLSVFQKFESMEMGEIAMSIITHGELLYGIEKSQHPRKSKKILEALLDLIPPLPLSPAVSQYYAKSRANLEKKGKMIGGNDLWIAAHAIALNIILVSNNSKEFSRVPHLKVENWVHH